MRPFGGAGGSGKLIENWLSPTLERPELWRNLCSFNLPRFMGKKILSSRGPLGLGALSLPRGGGGTGVTPGSTVEPGIIGGWVITAPLGRHCISAYSNMYNSRSLCVFGHPKITRRVIYVKASECGYSTGSSSAISYVPNQDYGQTQILRSVMYIEGQL